MKYIALLFTFLVSVSCAAAVISPGGGLGYTCTDNPGEKKTCTCSGVADCWWMGRSGVCDGDVVILTCGNDGKCTCDWKQKTSNPDGRFMKLLDGSLVLIGG